MTDEICPQRVLGDGTPYKLYDDPVGGNGNGHQFKCRAWKTKYCNYCEPEV